MPAEPENIQIPQCKLVHWGISPLHAELYTQKTYIIQRE
jgi:hypothetical protein